MSNEPKFTPGPWRVCERPGFTTNRKVIQTEDGEDLAATCYHEPEVTQANASLIAAAPEMYEFIKKNVNLMYWANHPELAEEGEKLLAKARGEKQGEEE